MSDMTGAIPPPTAPTVAVVAPSRAWVRPGGRRTLQLALATIWLFDGVLQLQAYFFTKAFGTQFIPMTAAGNPSAIARPITWSAAVIAHHAVLADSLFALVQVVLGLGIAWRPTLKVALSASIVWSVAVWWVGEGLGGVLSGAANPVNGAPGAVIIYALLAVLLWPSDRQGSRPSFIAARAVGAPVANALWLVLWGSLSYFAVLGANRSRQGLHDLINALSSGEPAWLASFDLHVASLVDHRGLAIAVVLALLLAMVACGVYLPASVANCILLLATGLSLVFWVMGENFGMLFTRGGTDVNSGPLLVLLSAAYWRRPVEAVNGLEGRADRSADGA